MEEKVTNNQKMSYEELENVAAQLSQQNQQLFARLQQADMTNMFKRLDYLFKVVKYNNEFPAEFTKSCIEEIVSMITIPDTEDTKDTKDE